jgi:hypothetical protein
LLKIYFILMKPFSACRGAPVSMCLVNYWQLMTIAGSLLNNLKVVCSRYSMFLPRTTPLPFHAPIKKAPNFFSIIIK